MHIRTDDEVYRVDAVWLGPPRATFPWRARYSAYGVGLLVMIFIMFVQRQLGIALGFFSVAWALLITVAVTRFVSRRINDERPLLEWLTLFAHELRGPRATTRTIGGALATGHVRVRRDRPALTGRAGTLALPRAAASPPEPDRPGGFGPPSSADIGVDRDREPDRLPGDTAGATPGPARPGAAPALPPAPPPADSAAAVVASWGGPERAEPVRVTARRVDDRAVDDLTAPFGPGAGRDPDREPRRDPPRRAVRDTGDVRAPRQEDDGAPPIDQA